MRGVHSCSVTSSGLSPGSSPHARGPQYLASTIPTSSRIIPACAGSTPLGWAISRWERDHPRMRGVHTIKNDAMDALQGSSPHARGPPQCGCFPAWSCRIIPACAGSTCTMTCKSLSSGDHPRMRGVHRRVTWHAMKALGSSPHARGPLANSFEFRSNVGIIPACAGSTL